MAVKSQKFKKVRDAHHREKAEDYVESILDLMETEGEARLTDISQHFGVSNVTAYKIIARLQRDGFITTRPYRAIHLTSQGKRLATQSRERHKVVYQFLRKIGVPEKIAHVDAEGIEHHVSPETLRIFKSCLE